MKIILSPNPFRDKDLRVARRARDLLTSLGVETVFCLPFLADADQRVELPQDLVCAELATELSGADMVICFGGDGTILHAAREANLHQIPILGINLGSVGFMAELEQGELDMLRKVAAGQYLVEERMMLDVRVKRGGRTILTGTALNDVVLSKGAVARVIDLSVAGDGIPIMDFSGDGVIVCTPTGSTAYSLSAGGPIVEPTSQCLIVTPICAHALNAKSIVLDRDRVVQLKIRKQSRKAAYLSVDGGKAFRLVSGDLAQITRSERKTRLVRLSNRNFYQVLHQKLGKV